MFASQDVSLSPSGWTDMSNEPNPILVEMRRVYRANGWKLRPGLELRLLETSYPNARPDQIAHARRVLWRLAALRGRRR